MTYHVSCYVFFMLLVCALSPVWLSVTPWTAARKAPLSVGLSRQEYRSGLTFPPPEDLPIQGSNLILPHLLQWQADSLPLSHWETLEPLCGF